MYVCGSYFKWTYKTSKGYTEDGTFACFIQHIIPCIFGNVLIQNPFMCTTCTGMKANKGTGRVPGQ